MRIVSNEQGVAAIEYCLIAGLLALGVMVGLLDLRAGVELLWSAILHGVESADTMTVSADPRTGD